MRGIDPDLLDPRLGCSLSLSPFFFNDGSRQSFSYHKLPQLPVKLSVLKLDGSSFDVEVARMASVAELKGAVEDVFRESTKEEQVEISWSHVWGHFCLSYKGHELVDDKAYIQKFGIKDGDQLEFVGHPSNYDNPMQRRLRNGQAACEQLAV